MAQSIERILTMNEQNSISANNVSANNMSESTMNIEIYKFAEKLNENVIKLMQSYDPNIPTHLDTLEEIKLHLDILSPIKDLQFKEQQLNMSKQITNSDFIKNFNIKDIMGLFGKQAQ